MPTASSPEPQPVDYETPPKERKPNGEFDPDHYRMTIGEHLEELRSRLVKGLIGFAVMLVVCLFFAKSHVIPYFCRPLVNAMYERGINPQLIVDEVGEGFMVYISISVISAATLASPWLLYQVWQFVAAGLYPHERKYVTRYLPVSIFLLIGGMVFVYFLVLPWSVEFFIDFNKGFFPTFDAASKTSVAATVLPPGQGQLPVIHGDPANPTEGLMWIDVDEGKLKIFFGGEVRVISINSPNLLAQEYKLSNYIGLVIGMLITFGLAFQLPLVVLALERIGIADVKALRAGRRYVYFALVIVAAVITPGDYVNTTIALLIPLIGLYELGIWLAATGKKRQTPATVE